MTMWQILIAQFYATVHFGTDDVRTLKWMTKDKVMTSTWGRFAELLGYSFQPDPETTQCSMGGGCMTEPGASDPEVLAPLYIPGWGKPG